jgi:hypothetical protein
MDVASGMDGLKEEKSMTLQETEQKTKTKKKTQQQKKLRGP